MSLLLRMGALLALLLVVAGGASPAFGNADQVTAQVTPPSDLETVINNLRDWLVGLLVALATLLLTIGGLRYVLAGGDPGEVGKAKDTLKYAALGYAVAAAAPLLVNILQGIVSQ